jgi:type II secretory pathway component GspD/PulD (secretin)
VAFRTNDDVFPLLTDILSTYWDPAARSGESDWCIAERRADEPFQAVNVSIDALLQEYEQLTDNVLIKDSSLAANALPISISVPKPVPRSELVRIIESVLLLNNYALIPGPEPKTVKVINMNTGKNPRSEGLPLYARPAWPSRR